MIMRITNVLVNYGDNEEASYEMDRPDWEISKVRIELCAIHPDCTSMVITLVRYD